MALCWHGNSISRFFVGLSHSAVAAASMAYSVGMVIESGANASVEATEVALGALSTAVGAAGEAWRGVDVSDIVVNRTVVRIVAKY